MGEHARAASRVPAEKRLRGSSTTPALFDCYAGAEVDGAALPPVGVQWSGKRSVKRASAGRLPSRLVAPGRAVAQVGIQLIWAPCCTAISRTIAEVQAALPSTSCRGRGRRLEDALAFARRDAGAGVSTCSTTTWPNGSSTMRTVTVPPAGVYCSALSTRLLDQLAQRSALPLTSGRRLVGALRPVSGPS